MTRDWQQILEEHQQVVSALAGAAPVLDRMVNALVACVRAGGRVWTLGNGGSAADAQHIAGELLGRFKRERAAFAAAALTADTATLTAIANDLGYEQVFARQLAGLARAGDIVWALSTSGSSPNVLAAVREAQARGALTIGFTGLRGRAFAEQCTLALVAPHASSDRVQEAHQLAYHYICERVEAALTRAAATGFES